MVFLHCAGGIPLTVSADHVAPASAVCDSANDCVPQPAPTDPSGASQPSWSSMKDRSVMGVSSGGFSSCQVSPRSVDRKSRLFATSAQTPFPEGALSCATFGNGMRLGDAVGAALVGAAVGLDVGVGLAAVSVADA